MAREHEIIPVPDFGRDVDPTNVYERLVHLAVDGLDSPHSKRAYEVALREFLAWHEGQGRPALTKATVQAYKAHLQSRELAPSSINVKLAAVRRLVAEAADNGLLDPVHANGIRAVKGVKQEGVRTGNWLTRDQAQELLNAPDAHTRKGRRDRAILAVLILAGLRREECARLTVEHLQQREGRWAIVDLAGKRGKLRTVPVKAIVKALVDDWCQAAGITSGPLWRGMRKGDRLIEQPGITSQAVWRVVEEYASRLGLDVSPHDLRRTYAKLAHKGGAAIEQISLNLGHGSIEVTERYLGVDLDLQNAPSDYIDLKVERQAGLEGR
jgi:integrase